MKNGLTSLSYLFITVNKYRFCISFIGYTNMQIIDMVWVIKKSISVVYQTNLCIHLF